MEVNRNLWWERLLVGPLWFLAYAVGSLAAGLVVFVIGFLPWRARLPQPLLYVPFPFYAALAGCMVWAVILAVGARHTHRLGFKRVPAILELMALLVFVLFALAIIIVSLLPRF